ncbi:unnamed protein product, partial [Closterium sp. NIES-54]
FWEEGWGRWEEGWGRFLLIGGYVGIGIFSRGASRHHDSTSSSSSVVAPQSGNTSSSAPASPSPTPSPSPLYCLSAATSSSAPTTDSSHGPWVCPVQTATRRKWLVNTAGARAVGEHWHRYQADSEEREVREEQEEQEVQEEQEEQEEQGALGVQVTLEALRAHGYTTRRR